MLTSSLFSILIIISSMILLVSLSFKGIGQVFAPLICAALVALVAQSGFINALFTIFPAGAASFLQRIMMPAISGTLFGELLAASGAAQTIGKKATDILGVNNGSYIIMVLTLILTLSGMTFILFIIAAFSNALMKESDLPPYIGMVAYIGFNEITAFCVPGVPHPINLLPTIFLGTDLYAGGIQGIVSAIVGYTLVIFFVRKLTKNARKNNIGYFQIFFFNENNQQDNRTNPIKLGIAVIPLITVIVTSYFFQKVANLPSTVAIFFGQTIAILLLIILCRSNFKGNIFHILEKVISNCSMFLLSCACMVGYAAVVSDTAAFISLQDSLAAMNLNPYVFTFVGVGLLSAITAEANSGIILFLESFGSRFISNPAIDLGAIHRIAMMTSAGFDSMPHSGNVLMNLKVFGLNHKTGYKYIFVTSVLIPTVYALCGLCVTLLLR